MKDASSPCRGFGNSGTVKFIGQAWWFCIAYPEEKNAPFAFLRQAGIVFLPPSSSISSQEQAGCTCYWLAVSPERLWIFAVTQTYYLWPPHWWRPTDRLTEA